jgi:apolipoprotein N-acyltransferase
VEFINTTTSPIGSIGAIAYTQAGNLALMQLTAITGLWGVTFLVSWLAPIVNWAWERSFAWEKIRRGLTLYVGVMLLVLAYGQARLAFAPDPADTVRVAGIVAVDYLEGLEEINQAMDEDWPAFRSIADARHTVYFEQTIREAQAGAQIVVWPEMAAPVAEEDEADLVAQAQAVARQEGIYLVMPMLVRNRADRPYENKLLVLDPAGQVAIEHYKYGGRGMEGNRLQGDGQLQTVATPFGTLSAIICWDTDFPGTVLQAGRNGTDILISPSLEFRELDPTHAYMAMARAIENGVSMVRVADNGLSVAYDPYGRGLAAVDHFTAGQRVLLAQVPTAGVNTLYPIIGDLFGWLAVAGFLASIVIGLVRGRRKTLAEAPLSEEDLAAAH